VRYLPPHASTRCFALALLASLLVGATPAELPRVDDFALLDQEGRSHRLSYYGDRKAVVLFVQGNGCPIARNAIPVLEALRAELGPRGVAFFGLNASPQDDRASVAREAREFGIGFPVLLDETQLVAESLGVTRTAEVFVVATDGWRVVYRGPVDDSQDYGAQRPARAQYLRDALLALLDGKPIDTPVREARGCLIHFPKRETRGGARISYADTIAPLLAAHCTGCHLPKGPAPFAMTSFETVRGWAPMIREAVRTHRMPPWHADPHVGRFANAIGLTPDEQRALVRWVEDGAPRDGDRDPLADAPEEPASEWALGKPDRIIAASEQAIPATGVVEYRYETVDARIERDVWVRGADLQPSNPRAMHHGLAWIEYPEDRPAPATEGPRFTAGMLAAYVPGREVLALPDGGGYFVPAGSKIRFQLHYTPTGRPERDAPRLALYFSDEPLAYELKTGAVARFDFAIPPGAADHRETAERTIERDILVYNLTPHMHLRGRSMRIEAHYPGGRSETLLSVPDYQFAWQRRYVFAEPKRIPAGTRLVVEAAFDNSARNPANPDPSAWVRYGEQTFDEMLFGYFLYRDLGPVVARADATQP
jgi:peroxiredoxin